MLNMQGSRIEYPLDTWNVLDFISVGISESLLCVCVCVCFVEIHIYCVFFRSRYPETFAHPVFLSLCVTVVCWDHSVQQTGTDSVGLVRIFWTISQSIANWKYHGTCRVSFKWSIRK